MKIEKSPKAWNLHDEIECHSHEKHEKFKVFNHGLILKKGHRVIKFNKKACLKPYEYWYEY